MPGFDDSISDHQPQPSPAPAAAELLPAVYDGLRAYVGERLSRAEGRAVDATEIVHEVYLRLAAQVRARYTNEAHFFAVAAGSVRRVLVDRARCVAAAKRGGKGHQTSLDSRVFGRNGPASTSCR